MTVPAGASAPGGEAPVVPSAPAATPAAEPVPGARKPLIPPIHKAPTQSANDVAIAARETLAARQAALAGNPAAPAAPAAGDEVDDAEDVAIDDAADADAPAAEAGADADADAGDDDPLAIALPILRDGQEDEIIINLPDQESADAIRAAIRGAIRADDAHAIREEAQALRDQAEEIEYEVELDPIGVVASRITSDADVDHLFRYLATRNGVLQRQVEWIADLVEGKVRLDSEAALVNAQRIERRDAIKPKIDEKREVNANARKIVNTTRRSIESMAPVAMTDERRQMLFDDVLSDVRRFAHAKNLRTVDPRAVPGLVERRLAAYGVAPRKAGAPKAVPRSAPGAKPVAPSGQRSSAQIVAAATKRRLAGSAPVGAGSAVASIPKPPKGSTIKQAADFARRMIAGRKAGPQ